MNSRLAILGIGQSRLNGHRSADTSQQRPVGRSCPAPARRLVRRRRARDQVAAVASSSACRDVVGPDLTHRPPWTPSDLTIASAVNVDAVPPRRQRHEAAKNTIVAAADIGMAGIGEAFPLRSPVQMDVVEYHPTTRFNGWRRSGILTIARFSSAVLFRSGRDDDLAPGKRDVGDRAGPLGIERSPSLSRRRR